MKLLYSAFFVFFLPLFSIAQSNYKPGYIVTLNGDTVKGYINYREWMLNPDKINFKNALNDDAIEYSTGNAVAFGINGLEYYERHAIMVSQDITNISVPVIYDSTQVNATVFLRLLSSGDKVSLYSYTDDIKTRYYITEKTDIQPKELIYRNYRDLKEPTTIRTVNRYRIQLQYILKKNQLSNGNNEKKVSTAQYLATDLTKIVEIINGSTLTRTSAGSNFGTRFFAGLGVNYSDLKVSEFREFRFEGTTIKNTPFPRIQAGIDLFTNKSTQRTAFRMELTFTASKHKIHNAIDRLALVKGDANLEYTHKIFSVSPQFIYNFYNTEKFKIFVNPGMLLNFSSYGKYAYKETYDASNYNREYEQDPPFTTTGISLIIKTGVSFKKFEIFAGYSPRIAHTDSFGYSFNTASYQAGFNWHFTK